ncbi:MAG TPA: dCTP deaminase [Allosphingosinicella sp.]|jgi:dCTP deaminase
MILTDREIRIAIETQQLRIDPAPASEAYASTSVDLTLGATLHVFKGDRPGVERVIDPSATGYKFSDVLDDLAEEQQIGNGGFELEPRQLILARTLEKINIPIRTRLAARVEGKSSLARIGLGVHITAPTIHAGFGGRIQLEVVNHGTRKIRLRTGMRICQLIFEMTLGVADKGYTGQFMDQMLDNA